MKVITIYSDGHSAGIIPFHTALRPRDGHRFPCLLATKKPNKN